MYLKCSLNADKIFLQPALQQILPNLENAEMCLCLSTPRCYIKVQSEETPDTIQHIIFETAPGNTGWI